MRRDEEFSVEQFVRELDAYNGNDALWPSGFREFTVPPPDKSSRGQFRRKKYGF